MIPCGWEVTVFEAVQCSDSDAAFNNLFKRNAETVAVMLIEYENKTWIEAEMADDWKESPKM